MHTTGVRSCTMIVPSAGRGARFGAETPKQYLPLGSSTVIAETVRRCLAQSEVARVVIPVSAEGEAIAREQLAGVERVEFVRGGETRQQSVLAGLALLADPDSIVAVHDVVRPFFTRELFLRLLDAAEASGASVPLLPLSDTLHRVENGEVIDSPPRSAFGLAQTPQVFRLGILRDALVAAEAQGVSGTDEAAVVRAAGHRVIVVAGEIDNFKITHPRDLSRAELLIRERS